MNTRAAPAMNTRAAPVMNTGWATHAVTLPTIMRFPKALIRRFRSPESPPIMTVLHRTLAFLAAAAVAAPTFGEIPTNALTQAERAAGWQLLFDGDDLDRWRNYGREGVHGWTVEDGTIVTDGGSGDLVSRDRYEWFELQIEYKISPGGNSGVMFHVTEDNPVPWHSGPEVQILDDPDGRHAQKTG